MRIAVVVPCRNEVQSIEECIQAIYKSAIPENWIIEVAIVDGKSDDGTIEKIIELQTLFSNLDIVSNEKQLTPFAFNLGIKHFPNADFYQIVGARQIIDANYIYSAVNRFKENKAIWCIGGKVENTYLNNAGRNISAAMSTTFGMGLGNFRVSQNSGFVDTVGTPMYPKFVFNKIGYFDEELIRNQDDDFNFRVTQAGGKIFYDHDISLKYYVRGNFKGLWKQFFQYGYWKVYVNKKHKAVTTIRQLVPPLFVLYLILFVLTSLFACSLNWLIILGLPMVLYTLMAIYYGFKAIKENNVQFMEVLKTFPILHISYGLGYLKGIVHFLLMGKRPSEKEKTLSR